MKRDRIFVLLAMAVTLVLAMGCGRGDITVEGFEAGVFEGWTESGEAFGGYPTLGALPGQEGLCGIEGRYLANSLAGGADAHGTLTSPEFVLQRRFVNFLIAGGNRPGIVAELLVDGNPIAKARPAEDGNGLQWHSWNVDSWRGRRAAVRITDSEGGPWGYVLIDRIEMSDREKSDVVTDYRQTFRITENFLTIPIQDDAPQAEIWIEANGRRSPLPLHIRIARQRTDYLMSMDVSEYMDRELTLIYKHIRKSDIGYGQIRQNAARMDRGAGKHTPAYHFAPQSGWMGEPVATAVIDGEYHIYYNFNPYGADRANLQLGHAVTRDLLCWEELPPALPPQNDGTILGGSIVTDANNSAGFGKDALVMLYTLEREGVRTQHMAYSTDKGRTFTAHDRALQLPATEADNPRDPYVFWLAAGRRWEMAIADGRSIEFYHSKDLKKWEKQGVFSPQSGDTGEWSRPNLFTTKGPDGKDKWVLTVNVTEGPGDAGGTHYFTGSFNGWIFSADDLPYPLRLDYGRDNSAAMVWSTGGREIITGWMSDGAYADLVPSGGSRGALVFPRELVLADGTATAHPGRHTILTATPAPEIGQIRGSVHYPGDTEVGASGQRIVSPLLILSHEDICEIDMTLHTGDVTDFGFSLSNAAGEHVDFDFDLKSDSFIVNRSESGAAGFDPSFSLPTAMPLKPRESYRVRLLVDRSSVECFIDGGALAHTTLVFPSKPYDTLTLRSYNGTLKVTDFKICKLSAPATR